MAMTGTFAADFSNFTAAVDAAETKLKAFESDSGKVETALNRMGNALSGTKMIQDALLMAKAVEDIGGVAKLTETELQRLGGQATDAIAKMERLGKEVPDNLRAVAKASQDAAKATTDWSGAINTLQGYLGAFGIQASISGVINFTKSVFDSASAIHDMGERLGISAEAVQGFKFAAEQAGSSIDTVGTAITKMNQHLAEGDKSTLASLDALGIDFQTIRNMRPEDAFLAITDAIKAVPDPMERSQIALQLFGKSAAELLPAIVEGFRQTSDGARKMSDDTIKTLEAAQDAWDKFGNSIVIVTGTILASLPHVADELTSSWGKFGVFAENVIKLGPAMAFALANANNQVKETVEFVGPLETKMHATKQATEEATSAYQKFAAAWGELNTMGTTYSDTIAGINPKLAEQASYYLRIGASVSTVAAAFPALTDAQVKALDAQVKATEAALAKIRQLEADHTKQVETNYLGLSKVENEFTQKGFENWAKRNKQIETLNQELTDDYRKQVMDRATFENLKIWEAAEAQKAAFIATGATAEQVTQFSDKLYEHTATLAVEVYGTTKESLVNLTDEGINAMIRLVAEQEKAVKKAASEAKAAADEAAAAYKQIYNVGSAGKDAGLGMGTDSYGNKYYIQPGQAQQPYGDQSLAGRAGIGIVGFRASGGPVAAGSPYVVGERGPELYVPTESGSIVPHGLGGGMAITIQITQPLGTPEAIARAVADAQVGLMRGQGVRLPYGT